MAAAATAQRLGDLAHHHPAQPGTAGWAGERRARLCRAGHHNGKGSGGEDPSLGCSWTGCRPSGAEQPTTAPQTQATVRHTHPARTIRTGYGADQAMAAGRFPVQRKKISKTAVRAEPTALRRATHAHLTETPTQLTAAEERAGDGRCDSNPKPRDAREEKQREARRTRRK